MEPWREELYHHGILGQKWGVRNGPPYPIEDKTLKAGMRLKSVSRKPQREDSQRWLYTYNNEWDEKIYKGPFSHFLLGLYGKDPRPKIPAKTGNGKLADFIYSIRRDVKQAKNEAERVKKVYKVYEQEYEVIKDLKMPTKKERIDEFIKMYSDKTNKAIVSKELSGLQSNLINYNHPLAKSIDGVDMSNLKTKDDYEKAYKVLNVAMEYQQVYKMTQKYAEIMSKKFDAMVDDNNQGIYNDARDPIIIFRADNALKKIGDARIVDIDEIQKNFDEVKSKQEKKGKKILY